MFALLARPVLVKSACICMVMVFVVLQLQLYIYHVLHIEYHHVPRNMYHVLSLHVAIKRGRTHWTNEKRAHAYRKIPRHTQCSTTMQHHINTKMLHSVPSPFMLFPCCRITVYVSLYVLSVYVLSMYVLSVYHRLQESSIYHPLCIMCQQAYDGCCVVLLSPLPSASL